MTMTMTMKYSLLPSDIQFIISELTKALGNNTYHMCEKYIYLILANKILFNSAITGVEEYIKLQYVHVFMVVPMWWTSFASGILFLIHG